MALHPALGPHLAGTTGLDGRLALAGLVVPLAGGGGRPGILSGAQTLVTTRADKFVDVAAFTAALSRGAADGVSFIANDGAVQVEVGAAPAANSRWDVLWARQRDSVTTQAPDPDNLPVFGVTQGAASATPNLATSLAAIPRGALPLASILVPAGATTTNGMTVGQIAPFTATAGSAFTVRNASELTTALRDSLVAGQRVFLADTGVLYEIRESGGTKRWTRLGGGTFTGTRVQGVGNNANSQLGAFTRDANASDRDDFYTPGSGQLLEGDYAVSLTMGTPALGNGRNFVEIGNTPTPRNGFGAGEDTATVSSNIRIGPGGGQLVLRAFVNFNQTGLNPVFRLAVTKIA